MSVVTLWSNYLIFSLANLFELEGVGREGREREGERSRQTDRQSEREGERLKQDPEMSGSTFSVNLLAYSS